MNSKINYIEMICILYRDFELQMPGMVPCMPLDVGRVCQSPEEAGSCGAWSPHPSALSCPCGNQGTRWRQRICPDYSIDRQHLVHSTHQTKLPLLSTLHLDSHNRNRSGITQKCYWVLGTPCLTHWPGLRNDRRG